MTLMHQIGGVIGSIFLLLFLLYQLEVWTTRRLASRLGWNAVLFTGLVGTPIHEMGHLIFCIVFCHKIHEIALFSPDRSSGTLGYVRHSYNKKSIYQRSGTLFIGVAPFFTGLAALLLLTHLMYPHFLPDSVFHNTDTSFGSFIGEMANSSTVFIKKVFTYENIATWQFWLYLYLCLCIAAHLAPSACDLKGTWPGLVIAIIVILIAGGLVYYFNFQLREQQLLALKNFCFPIISYLMFGVILSFVNFCVTYVVTGVLSPKFPHV